MCLMVFISYIVLADQMVQIATYLTFPSAELLFLEMIYLRHHRRTKAAWSHHDKSSRVKQMYFRGSFRRSHWISQMLIYLCHLIHLDQTNLQQKRFNQSLFVPLAKIWRKFSDMYEYKEEEISKHRPVFSDTNLLHFFGENFYCMCSAQ